MAGCGVIGSGGHRVYWSKGPNERDELRAELIINFSGMCLVRTVGDPAWWMGQLHQNGESIVCWGHYGTDLARAIDAL